MTAADELVQVLTLRFLKSGMSEGESVRWARVAVEAIADALEERGVPVADHLDGVA